MKYEKKEEKKYPSITLLLSSDDKQNICELWSDEEISFPLPISQTLTVWSKPPLMNYLKKKKKKMKME